jgi:hypothetical protein
MKLKLTLIVFFLIATNALAQNMVTTSSNQPYKASDVYLTFNRVVFTDAKTKREIYSAKNLIKSILFSNGLLITYSLYDVQTTSPTNYNSTINFVNGDFITAEVIRISADTVSYQSPVSNDILFLSTKDVIEINYINGIREHFTSNDKAFAKAPKEKPDGPPPINTNSSKLYCGISLGSMHSYLNNRYDYYSGGYYNSDPYNLKRFSPSLSLYYDIGSSNSFNVNLTYAPKGQGVIFNVYDNSTFSYSQYASELKLSYLEIPFSYQLQLGSDKFKFFGEAGFCVGYLLSAKNIETKPTSKETKVTSDLNRFEFGMSLGAGFKYYLKSGVIITGIQYEFDFTSLGGYNQFSVGNNTVVSTGGLNRSFIFYAGYAINIDVFKKKNSDYNSLKGY